MILLRGIKLIILEFLLFQLSFSEIIRLKDGEFTYEYDNSSEPLGEGFYATVYAGVRIEGNSSECVVFKVSKNHWGFYEKGMLHEKNMYEMMGQHDSLPKFYHYFPETNETRPVLVIERLGSTLTDLWNELRPFSNITVMKIGLQILDVLEYMHSNGFTHGDLHSDNVAVGYKNNSKIYLFDFNVKCSNKENRTSDDLDRLGYILNSMIRPSLYYTADLTFKSDSEFRQICDQYLDVSINNESVRNETFEKLRHILWTELDKHRNGTDYEETDIDDDFGLNRIFKLIKLNDTCGIENLIQQGIEINAGFGGYNPIHLAAELGNAALVQILIDNGAELNAKSNNTPYGISPLYFAIRVGSVEVTQILVEHGAEIDAVDFNGKTAYQYAAKTGKKRIAEILDEAAQKELARNESQ